MTSKETSDAINVRADWRHEFAVPIAPRLRTGDAKALLSARCDCTECWRCRSRTEND